MIMEKGDDTECNVCEKAKDDVVVRFYCQTCQWFLCEKCCEEHKNKKRFTSHIVERLDKIQDDKNMVSTHIIDEQAKQSREIASVDCKDHSVGRVRRCYSIYKKSPDNLLDLNNHDDIKPCVGNLTDQLSDLRILADDIENTIETERKICLNNKIVCMLEADDFFNNIINTLKHLQKEVKNIIENAFKSNTRILDEIDKTCKESREMIQNTETNSKEHHNDEIICEQCLLIRKPNDIIETVKLKLDKVKDSNITTVSFKQNKALKKAVTQSAEAFVLYCEPDEVISGREETAEMEQLCDNKIKTPNDEEKGQTSRLTTRPCFEEQRQLLDASDTVELGQSWHMLDLQWVNQWQTYIGADEWNLDLAGLEGQYPGPIDNSSLFEEKSAKLKKDLLENQDYVLAPPVVWNELLSWYGLVEGQVPISCPGINGDPSCGPDVKLWTLTICEHKNLDSKRQIPISQFEKVGKLERLARELFKISPIKKIKIRYNGRQLLCKDFELHKYLEDEATVVLEQQNDDGTWPAVHI